MSSDREARLNSIDSCDDVEELVDLGCELADDDRGDDAERCFRRAAHLGSAVGAFNLGNTLSGQQRWGDAVLAYEQALAGGVTAAWLNLGLVLEEHDDDAGARRAFTQAAQAGDSGGALALAFCLREQGQTEDALAAVKEAAGAGNAMAGGVLACWEWDRTGDLSLEPALRAGADHYPSARADLAHLLRSTGRSAEAEAVLEHGRRLGEAESWLPLGSLYLDDLGDREAAEAAYRSGIAAGDNHCADNLRMLLDDTGAAQAATEADAPDAPLTLDVVEDLAGRLEAALAGDDPDLPRQESCSCGGAYLRDGAAPGSTHRGLLQRPHRLR